MRFAWMRASLVASGLSAAAAIACSSSSSTPAGPPPGPTCPPSLSAALTASCSSASETCPYLYTCDGFGAPATCACDGHSFLCTDSANVPFTDDGAAPTCTPLDASKGCPLSEFAANLAACTDLGLQCTYPSACKGTPAFDTCQCIPDPTGGGAVPHYECIPGCTVFPRPDAAPADAAIDASADAPTDSALTDSAPTDHADATPPPDAPAD